MAGFGLRPVRHLNGAPWNGATVRAFIEAADGTATFIGDAVKIDGTASSTGTGEEAPSGVISVKQVAASQAIFGVVVSFEPDRTNLNLQYRTASTARFCNLVVDPTVVFVMEEDGAGTPIALASIGLNFNIVVGSGNTTTGRSAMQINSDTNATTATLPLKLLGLYQFAANNGRVGNSSAPLAQWEVAINNWQVLSGGTGVAGV